MVDNAVSQLKKELPQCRLMLAGTKKESPVARRNPAILLVLPGPKPPGY
jgi:hypothetical protein